MARTKKVEEVRSEHSQTAAEAKANDPSVASESANEELEHSEGGVTTRDDKNDLGVPMLPGSPGERQGPEDALGEGPTRGDYRLRIGDANYHPHDGVEPQRPRAEEIGDVPGKKGGVETAGK